MFDWTRWTRSSAHLPGCLLFIFVYLLAHAAKQNQFPEGISSPVWAALLAKDYSAFDPESCWMVSHPESVMWLRTLCLCFLVAAVCLMMSCHRASGEGKFHQIVSFHHCWYEVFLIVLNCLNMWLCFLKDKLVCSLKKMLIMQSAKGPEMIIQRHKLTFVFVFLFVFFKMSKVAQFSVYYKWGGLTLKSKNDYTMLLLCARLITLHLKAHFRDLLWPLILVISILKGILHSDYILYQSLQHLRRTSS